MLVVQSEALGLYPHGQCGPRLLWTFVLVLVWYFEPSALPSMHMSLCNTLGDWRTAQKIHPLLKVACQIEAMGCRRRPYVVLCQHMLA